MILITLALSVFKVLLLFFQKEKLKCQKDYMESVKRLEEQSAGKQEKHGHRKVKFGPSDDDGSDQKSNSEVLHNHSFT